MLAIVIPYYNIKFFESTLESLCNQTDHRFKVYIGNDASPETPLTLINQYKDRLKISYKDFKSNLGNISLVKHWDRCINLINDEGWIMILGDDDILGKNVVEEFYKCMECFNGNSNIIRFASQIIDDQDNLSSIVFQHPEWEIPLDSYLRKVKGTSRSSLSEYIFSKKSYIQYKFHHYPLAWHSDDRAWFEFSLGKKIFTINNAVVLIRISNNSISGRIDNIGIKNKATLSFYKFLISQQLIELTEDQENFIINMCKNHLKKSGDYGILENLFLLKYFLTKNDFKSGWALSKNMIKGNLYKVRRRLWR